jgi:mannosyl-oligosaccharide glucosidase
MPIANETFNPRFGSVFQPQHPFHDQKFAEFSQSLLSNLLGGIGYFYGSNLVDTSNQAEYEEEAIRTQTHTVNHNTKPVLSKPVQLTSCVPSRAFFPRGFLWDEGFHQLIVLDWDLDLSIDILQGWLALMDDKGWIPREQILGPEARSKVPHEFQIMYPHHANPPTLFLVAKEIMQKLLGKTEYSGAPSRYINNEELSREFLEQSFQKLHRWYLWFRTNQAGNGSSITLPDGSPPDLYRFRGRTSQHILASGLDDYPRSEPPSLGELHIDAASWAGLMATVLRDMASALGHNTREFESQLSTIKASINTVHWSPESKAYCDTKLLETGFSHVCHLGYVSLMPFLTGLLEHDSPRIGDILDLISDDKKLWSPHGLRSLSLTDRFYGTDENYWRGPVWLNMNFMAVQRLLELAQVPGQHQLKARRIYTDLRRNLVTTVFESWKNTGYAWEQYNPDTGVGQRTAYFTGWTALVVKIMAFPDLGDLNSDHNFYRHVDSKEPLPMSFYVVVIVAVAVFLHCNRRQICRLVATLKRRYLIVRY